MYSREINGELHTFGVSGKLIMNVLVMYDHQTRTLWSQFLHRGVEGELEGVELDVIPVTQTTWGAWKELYPDTKFLDLFMADPYDSYYVDDNRPGVIGERNSDDRLRTKSLVVGVNFNGVPKAYPLDALESQPVVNDAVAGQDALIYFDAPSGSALVYDRSVNGRVLDFSADPETSGVLTTLVDEQTGSRWMAFTGLAVEGELAGQRLERIPSHLSFWFAWTDWNPETELFTS